MLVYIMSFLGQKMIEISLIRTTLDVNQVLKGSLVVCLVLLTHAMILPQCTPHTQRHVLFLK